MLLANLLYRYKDRQITEIMVNLRKSYVSPGTIEKDIRVVSHPAHYLCLQKQEDLWTYLHFFFFKCFKNESAGAMEYMEQRLKG